MSLERPGRLLLGALDRSPHFGRFHKDAVDLVSHEGDGAPILRQCRLHVHTRRSLQLSAGNLDELRYLAQARRDAAQAIGSRQRGSGEKRVDGVAAVVRERVPLDFAQLIECENPPLEGEAQDGGVDLILDVDLR
jgi:hypothetical protein